MKRVTMSLLLAWAALYHHGDITVDALAQISHQCPATGILHRRASSVVRKATDNNEKNNAPDRHDDALCVSRKAVFRKLGILAAALTLQPQLAHSACLAGDPSPDCIGIYKIPIDSGAERYMDSPEKLTKFAPDVRWVPPVEYPKSYKAALKELKGLQQKSLPPVSEFVLKGDLEQAGVALLKITPRVTVAGRVVARSLDQSANQKDGTRDRSKSIKAHRVELALDDLLSKLGETDVMIGQAIAGNLGALAPAQIQILAELKEATTFFEDLFRYIE